MDPEQGGVVPRESDPSSTSGMRNASATEKGHEAMGHEDDLPVCRARSEVKKWRCCEVLDAVE